MSIQLRTCALYEQQHEYLCSAALARYPESILSEHAIERLTAALNDLASIGSVQVKPGRDRRFQAAYGWWAFITRSSQAVLTLRRGGLEHEATPIVRSILQHGLVLQWLVEVGDTAIDAVSEYGDDNKRLLLQTMQQANWPPPDSASLHRRNHNHPTPSFLRSRTSRNSASSITPGCSTSLSGCYPPMSTPRASVPWLASIKRPGHSRTRQQGLPDLTSSKPRCASFRAGTSSTSFSKAIHWAAHWPEPRQLSASKSRCGNLANEAGGTRLARSCGSKAARTALASPGCDLESPFNHELSHCRTRITDGTLCVGPRSGLEPAHGTQRSAAARRDNLEDEAV